MVTSNYEFGFSGKIIRQVAAIFTIQASSTISFAVFFSGLSLYLTNHLQFTENSATSITAVFLAFNYFLPLIGGSVANKLVSYKNLFCVGIAVSGIGCLALAYTDFYNLGFSLFLISSLVSSVCINMFLTQLFPSSAKAERRVAFIWNYVGMNLGFMLGFALTGWFSLENNYHDLFLLMAFFKSLTLILTLFFIDEPSFKKIFSVSLTKQVLFSVLIMSAAIALLYPLFIFANQIENKLTYGSVIIMAAYLFYVAYKLQGDERRRLMVFMAYLFVATAFWAFYMLTPTAMMQIIYNDVDRHIFGILLAPQWIQNIDSIIILCLAPVLAFYIKQRKRKYGHDQGTTFYFSTGLFFQLIAFILFIIGLTLTHRLLSMWVMIGYLALMTFGEIALNPASSALIGELIPEDYRGMMTGILKMNIGVAVMIAGTLAKKMILPYVNPQGLSPEFTHSLVNLYWVLGGALIVFMLLTQLIGRHSKQMI